MRWVAAAGLVIAIAIAAWWLLARDAAPAPATRGDTMVATGGLPGAAPAHPHPAAHVTKITPEERRQLDERIAAAHAAHPAHSAPAAPSLPPEQVESSHDLDHLSMKVLVALKEAIPFLAECYDQQAPELAHGLTFAMMTLTGDPDIGTVIDAGQMLDGNHQPLPKRLDDCLRNTMQTLQLPPLEEGDSVAIQYSFSLGDDRDGK